MSPSVPPPNLRVHVPRELPPPPPSRRPYAKLLAPVALAAVLAGLAFTVLGGTGSRVIDPVAEAATVSSGAPGYRMHFSLEVTSSVSATPLTATGKGTFDPRDHTGSMSLAMNLGSDPQVIQSLGSDTVTLHEILEGTTVYMKLPASAASALPTGGKQWVAVNFAKLKSVPGLSSLASNPVSSDPSQILQYLRAVSDSVVAVGHQRIDGRQTIRYHADLSLDRIVAALPSSDQSAAQQALSALEHATQLSDIPVDVWVDAQHLVRRIEMSIIIGSVGSGQSLDEAMTIDISHYGPQPPPALPPAADVANLSGLVGSGG